MAKYCAKCRTFVYEEDICPGCGNRELKKIGKKPEKRQAKKLMLVWVALGALVLLTIVLLWVNMNRYSEGSNYALLDDGTYEVSGIGSFNGTRLNIPPEYNGAPVTQIRKNAFEGCRELTEIKIPKSVTDIRNWAFENCTDLKKFEVDKKNEKYVSIDGVLFTKDKTRIIAYEYGAFEKCFNLRNVEIPDSVTEIGICAFENCRSLTEIKIPKGVTEIKSWTFSGCKGLTEIKISGIVTSIETGAFHECDSLADIYYAGSISQWNAIDKKESNIPAPTIFHLKSND